jgi:glycosyltransferase involved in cell wall biosynthesis
MISIIIPSYNSERTIDHCLSSLINQSYQREKEIILVDSSVDRTPDIVCNKFPKVKFLHFDIKTDPGTARNKGVEISRGDLILFIDSDCTAGEDWIKKMVDNHEKFPKVSAIGGSVENSNLSGDPVGMAGYMAEFREFIPQGDAGFVGHVPTLNISYKRWVFDKFGFFDPDYYPQEDLLFNYHLTRGGGKIYFDPEIRVKHLHRSTFKSFLHHQKRIGAITAIVLKELDLTGATIIRRRGLFSVFGPLLPLVKFSKTMSVFLRKDHSLISRNPLSVVLFKIGLWYWFIGLCSGVYFNRRF